jgi:hypothetical protein
MEQLVTVVFTIKMASSQRKLCYLPMAAQRASSFSVRAFMAGKRGTLIMDDLGRGPLYCIHVARKEKPEAAAVG